MSNFTYDWLTPQLPFLERHVPRSARFLLELGSFEGRSTVWFLEHAPESQIVCVDHFRGGSDHAGIDVTDLFDRFWANVEPYRGRVGVMAQDTWQADLSLYSSYYDFVFVDASHEAHDVLHDAIVAYRCALPGAVIIFDDYGWGSEGQSRPKEAIDAFLLCFAKKIEVLEKAYMVAVRKVC